MAHVRDREGCLRTLSQLSAACRFAVPSPAAALYLCPLWRLPRSGRVDAAYLGGGAAGQRETDSGPVGVLHRVICTACTAGCLGTLLAGTRQWRRRLAQRCSSSGFFRPRTSRLMDRPIYRRTGITATSAVMQRANLYILIGFFLPQSLGGCRCTASSIRGYDAPAATQK